MLSRKLLKTEIKGANFASLAKLERPSLQTVFIDNKTQH